MIEDDFVCSEHHRAFFKDRIGKKFTFNVVFQKWLKSNAGKTYEEANKNGHVASVRFSHYSVILQCLQLHHDQ